MKQLALFKNPVLRPIKTEGIKYAGSKQKLIPYILQLAQKVNAHTVIDGFAGSTKVSQAFAQSGYKVICNDVAIWSKILGTCYLLNNKKPEYYQPLIDHLNHVEPFDGWFTENYGGAPNDGRAIQSDGLKKPWQIHNTRKLDAIRQEIDALNLTEMETAVALTSLMLALDRVDNTLGHFVSYLRDWSPRSYNNLVLKIPSLFYNSEQHKVFTADIFDLIPHVSADLAYFDPPYGSNNEKMPPSRVRYASYYHLWTTICLNDEPALFGKAKRRKDTSDRVAASIFEEFRKDEDGRFIAVKAIEQLIQSTQVRWIILSYSSGGRATADELNRVLRCNGNLLEVVEIDYKKNVMAGMKWTNEWLREAEEPNKEFLFLLERK